MKSEADIVICDICSGCFRLQKWSKEFSKTYYQLESRVYRDKKTSDLGKMFQERYQKISKPRFNFISHFLNLNPHSDLICEVGAYDGVNLYPWKLAGFETLGFELDVETSKIAKSYEISMIDEDFLKYNFKKLPKLIILSHVLEHLDDLKAYFLKFKEILAPTGILFVEVPGIRSEGFGHLNSYFDVEHVCHFEKKTLKHLFEKNGFSMMYGDEYIRSFFVRGDLNVGHKGCQLVANSLDRLVFPSLDIRTYLGGSQRFILRLSHKLYFVGMRLFYGCLSLKKSSGLKFLSTFNANRFDCPKNGQKMPTVLDLE